MIPKIKSFLKRRTVLGVLALVGAFVVMLVIAPLTQQALSPELSVVRLKGSVSRGTQITEKHLETVSVNANAVPVGVITNTNDIIGLYANSSLYKGDFLTNEKLSTSSVSADDKLVALDGKIAISIPISSFAGSLSGKLQNGDIVRIYVVSRTDSPAIAPEKLQWVEVITTTTNNGIDQDKITENDDGSHDMPATVTVLVNHQQAQELVQYSNTSTLHLALISRGDVEKANDLLRRQEAICREG